MIKTTIDDCRFPELVQAAKEALQNSYSPYSNYKVGAALLTEQGKIFTGCNVENGSYGASNCAERTAVFKAVSEGQRRFTAIAIAAEDTETPPFPCGICRQVISEFCSQETPVLIYDGNGAVYNAELGELIPHAFDFKRE
ncbi:MAG: cytidine deaminase [Oscillospiraceae bacterium]|nr:cytidine deaminase [Oscillospiraceae bacterium]